MHSLEYLCCTPPPPPSPPLTPFTLSSFLSSPRSLSMKEFDPAENIYDWRNVADRERRKREAKQKVLAAKKKKKEEDDAKYLEQYAIKFDKEGANQERSARQKHLPLWRHEVPWTQFTEDGTLMHDWDVAKMENLVRAALAEYYDELEASGVKGVVRRGLGHWKDDMKVLPPALGDLLSNVSSFFSSFNMSSPSKKKVAPTPPNSPTRSELDAKIAKHVEADADAEAEEVLSGTCRHGRKREDCRECKEHSPDKKNKESVSNSINHTGPDAQYMKMMEKLGGLEGVSTMADNWTKYAEVVRKKSQREGESASLTTNPGMEIADACLIGSTIRVISGLATGSADPDEKIEGTPLLHISLKQALLLDDMNDSLWLNSSNTGDRAKFQKILDVFNMYGADMDIFGPDGEAGIHMAAAHGNLKMIEYFLKKKTDVNLEADIGAHDLTGGTPMMFAAKFGHVETVAHLARRGGYVNIEATNGNTSLHFAADRGESRMCMFLMKIGADKKKKNKEGFLAGQLANISGHRICAQIILEYAVLQQGPEALMQYLNDKLDVDKKRHNRDKTLTDGKKAVYSAANKFFEGTTKFVDDLLALIPYFKRKQAEVKAMNTCFFPPSCISMFIHFITQSTYYFS